MRGDEGGWQKNKNTEKLAKGTNGGHNRYGGRERARSEEKNQNVIGK